MSIQAQNCLNSAIEITKEYTRGGGQGSPEAILEQLYNKLKELQNDASKQ